MAKSKSSSSPSSKDNDDGSTKEKSSMSSSSSSSSSPSLINIVLTCVLMVGVGAIVGYLIFYSIYNHRCSDMMDDAERRFNHTKEELSNKLIEAMHKGATNEATESELLEMRGRLEGSTGLMGKHQALLVKYEETVQHLSQAQMSLDRLVMRNSEMVKEMKDAEKKLAETQETLNKATLQKDAMEKRLQQSAKKIEDLQAQAQDAGNSAACQQQQQKSMAYIEKLHTSMCKEKHGDGPYYVQFDMEVDGDETDGPSSFLVEVATLSELPHSVFSFMTLVMHDVYVGAEFLSTQSIIHLDSDEEIVVNLGYATSALSLAESSSPTLNTCAPYSVGFVGANGGLKIIMTNDASKHGTLACFGRIAQGRQTVSRIQRAGREGKTVSITSLRVVELESKPSMGEGEL